MTAPRPHLLLTNDDGADSPLFELLVEACAPHGDLSIAVPAKEQSWQGKSMTRHGRISVESIQVAGHDAFAIDGTPADCVNIALHNLLPSTPDAVISGINVGVNAGLSLVWASGTVGACLEGNIAGLPGLALSQQLAPETYAYWDTHRAFEVETLARLRQATLAVVPELFAQLLAPSMQADPVQGITWNVNLPFELSSANAIEHSYLGHSWYGQCFTGTPEEGFQHRMQPFERDTHPDADNNVLARGSVSVTRLDMHTFGRRAEP